jgi:hypothetical protein
LPSCNEIPISVSRAVVDIPMGDTRFMIIYDEMFSNSTKGLMKHTYPYQGKQIRKGWRFYSPIFLVSNSDLFGE